MSSTNKELTSKMVQAGAAAGAPVIQAAKMDAVAQLFSGRKHAFARLLGKSLDVERFIQVLATQVRNNENLTRIAVNNPISVLAACQKIAQVGLDPSIPNEAFLVPYGNECVAQYGYKGLAKLATEAAIERGLPLRSLRQESVKENDTYERELGSDIRIIHRPPKFPEPRGATLGYYAIAVDLQGMVYFDEMTVDEVDQHQQRFCKGLKHANSLWYGGRKNPNFDAYGLKTILRRMINRYMPMNAKLARAIQNDPDSETAIDVTPEEVLPELLKGGEGDDGNQEERTKEGGQEKLL